MAALDFTKLSGMLKVLYAKAYKDLVPENAWITKNIKFASSEKIGDVYRQMVILTQSHGFTYGGNTATNYSLVEANPMTSAPAEVKGHEFTLREVMPIGAIKRAASSTQAFTDYWTLVYEKMMTAFLNRLEVTYRWGGRGIGIVTSSANASATTTNITLKLSDWSAGIWAGLENAKVSFYTSNTTLVSSAADSVFTVTSVDPSTRVVLITGTATGITALDSAIGSNPDAVYVYFSGILGSTPLSSFGNEPTGLYSIISNTGTLFGINAASYVNWKGNTYSAGSAAFNFGKATAAVAQVAARTGAIGDFHFLVNPKTWNNLNTNEAANRIYDSSYDKGRLEQGAQQITYWGQTGKITFQPDLYMKEGFAFGLFKPNDSSVWRRVGSTEVTNEIQGSNEQLVLSADANSVETRLYADQAPFCSEPSKQILINNIVNS